jgi:hypothetical protein
MSLIKITNNKRIPKLVFKERGIDEGLKNKSKEFWSYVTIIIIIIIIIIIKNAFIPDLKFDRVTG